MVRSNLTFGGWVAGRTEIKRQSNDDMPLGHLKETEAWEIPL